MLEKNAKYLIYSGCIDCGFKKFETIDKKNWVIYWKLKLSIKQCFRLVWNVEKKKKKKESKSPRVAKKNKGKPILFWKCAVCDNENSKFIKQQNKKLMDYWVLSDLRKTGCVE